MGTALSRLCPCCFGSPAAPAATTTERSTSTTSDKTQPERPTKRHWVDEKGNSCFMLLPRGLSIAWAEDPSYWAWLSPPPGRRKRRRRCRRGGGGAEERVVAGGLREAGPVAAHAGGHLRGCLRGDAQAGVRWVAGARGPPARAPRRLGPGAQGEPGEEGQGPVAAAQGRGC
ncbi:hypothetical protein ACQJBY_004811 [Aegilops geniculata]